MKKAGQKNPEYEVTTELWIDEEIISEEELRLIEREMADIIRTVLDNEVTEGGK